MVDRLISVGDDLTLPPSVNVTDENLPERLGATQLSATIAEDIEASPVVTGKLDKSVASSTLVPSVVPVYAGARTKTWNPYLCLYNGESPTMRTVRNLVAKALAGSSFVRLSADGDSKTRGSGVTQAESMEMHSYPGQLRDILAAKDGAIYAQFGDKRWHSNTNWTYITQTSSNYLLSNATGLTSTVTLTLPPCTGFDTFAYCSASGPLTITVDGGAAVTFTVGSGSMWKKHTISGLANTAHTVVFSTSVNMALSHVEPKYATTTGLTISNAGRDSSHAGDWKDQNWSTLYNTVFGVQNTVITKPDIALLNIGTNTGTSTLADIETVATNIKNLGVPLVLIAFGGIVQDGGHYDSKRTKLYDIADTLDLPLVDFTQVIGNNTKATAAGLMADTVHENSRGYSLEAAAMARVLATV